MLGVSQSTTPFINDGIVENVSVKMLYVKIVENELVEILGQVTLDCGQRKGH